MAYDSYEDGFTVIPSDEAIGATLADMPGQIDYSPDVWDQETNG